MLFYSFMNLIQIFVLTFVLHLPVVSHAATLINGFSGGPVSGSSWTGPSDPSIGVTSNFSTNFSASTGSVAGLVNTGFVTVDYQAPFPPNLTYSYYVAGYDDFGGPGLSMSDITGFNVSLRKEANNSAFSLNFFIIGSNDNVYEWNISTLDLSTTEFRSIPIVLSSNSAWASGAPAGAWTIGVDASYANPASARYNFSIDSISAVPEPSSGLLLLSGLGTLVLLRRRKN
jgi:hypothetical protein